MHWSCGFVDNLNLCMRARATRKLHVVHFYSWNSSVEVMRGASVFGSVVKGTGRVTIKGVGPGMTLAWPGWKQSVIAVEVDTGRLETSRFKKCYANFVLLYFPSTEIKSAFNVYWHGGGAAGLSCTELSIWELPFLRGGCQQARNSIWYCVNGMPQKETLDKAAYTCLLVSYRRLSAQFKFSLSAVTLGYLSQWLKHTQGSYSPHLWVLSMQQADQTC